MSQISLEVRMLAENWRDMRIEEHTAGMDGLVGGAKSAGKGVFVSRQSVGGESQGPFSARRFKRWGRGGRRRRREYAQLVTGPDFQESGEGK